ncbi:PhzF family phenazine biosynthesis protein [Halobacteriales archaeon Cl-PHB]
METRDVALVDAFADEPMAGVPVGVLRDGGDLTADQREAIAGELGAPATAFLDTGGDGTDIAVAGPRTAGLPVHVGVAATAALSDRGDAAGGLALTTDDGDTLETTMADDGVAWVDVPSPDLREPEVTEQEVAAALGIDVAALRDVGADLPLGRGSLGPSFLLVAVNFLEHLAGAEPDPAAVAELLETVNADAVYAFTFDTLAGANDVHARTVRPAEGELRPPGEAAAPGPGLGAACCGAHLRRHGVFDHDRDEIGVEAGDFRDRPTRLRVDLADHRVGGRSVTVLDGTVVVPDPETDDIIEA